MKAEDIKLLQKLTKQAKAEAEAVAKKLVAIDFDFDYVDSFSFDDEDSVMCTGTNNWGDGTIEHICVYFPYELLGASDEVIDEYIAKEQRRLRELKEANEKYEEERARARRKTQYE